MSQIQYFGNLAPAKLQAAITNSATTFTISGVTWPDISGALFVVELGSGLGDDEKILCSGHSGGLVTVATSGRGYDGTTAVAHQAGEGAISVFDAASATDFSGHIYDTSRDDHTMYARVDGSRAITGDQQFTGGVNVTGGGLTVAAGGGTTSVQALSANGAVSATGNGSFGGTLAATGAATLSSSLTVAGQANLNGGVSITGALSTSQELSVPDLKVTGLTGLTAARFVGMSSAVGPPTSGTYEVGDVGIDAGGALWVCTTAGAAGAGAQFQMCTGTLVGDWRGPAGTTIIPAGPAGTLGSLSVPVLLGATYEVSAAAGGVQQNIASNICYLLVTSDDGVLDVRPINMEVALNGQFGGGSSWLYTPASSRTTTFTAQLYTNAGQSSIGADGANIIVKRVK